MRFLLRVIGLFLILTAALKIVRGLLTAFAPAGQVPAKNPGHLVKDPVCGMYVPQANAIQGSDQFFCSEECRSKFGARISDTV